jgi:hypothetical protein
MKETGNQETIAREVLTSSHNILSTQVPALNPRLFSDTDFEFIHADTGQAVFFENFSMNSKPHKTVF